MRVAGIEFEKGELDSFQAFVIGAGSGILRQLLEKYSNKALTVLTNPQANMEQIRYAQGTNDGIAALLVDIKDIAAYVGDSEEDMASPQEPKDDSQIVMDF